MYHDLILYKTSLTVHTFYHQDKQHLLFADGSHVSTLKCLYDCLLDNMFVFLSK